MKKYFFQIIFVGSVMASVCITASAQTTQKKDNKTGNTKQLSDEEIIKMKMEISENDPNNVYSKKENKSGNKPTNTKQAQQNSRSVETKKEEPIKTNRPE